jgi:hypothetical protein
MRQQLGVADPRFNLARAWAGYGRPAGGPVLGAIVVWRITLDASPGRAMGGRAS